MRQPPPVGVTCSGGGVWRLAQSTFSLLAVGVGAAWLALLLDASPAIALAAALAAAAPVATLWRLSLPRLLRLQWDGPVWPADSGPGAVTVTLDLGARMLVRSRAQAGGPVRWLPLPLPLPLQLPDREVGSARHAMRAALFSPAAPQRPATGSPGQGFG